MNERSKEYLITKERKAETEGGNHGGKGYFLKSRTLHLAGISFNNARDVPVGLVEGCVGERRRG